jgi:hypothetical protein
MDIANSEDKKSTSTTRPTTSWLHPRVYAAVIGLVVWFVVWVWSFAGVGVTDYLLFIVSGFFFIAVSLPLILSRVGRAHNATNGDATKRDDKPAPFRDWARGDFDTWQGRLTGAQAAMQIILPIAAAAFGMTAIGIAFHIAEHGGV